MQAKDRGKLLSVSYSKLDLLDQCNYRYYLKYILGNYSNASTLPLDIGSILHKGLELKGRYKMHGVPVDYDEIIDNVLSGCEEITDKGSEHIIGIDEIRKKYFEEYNTPDNASGMTYVEKMDIYFHEVLPNRMEDEIWRVLGTEIKFEFVYQYGENDDGSPKEVVIHGFIDRVDKSADEQKLKVIDYKSSKKVFPDTKIKTPLQMIIYDLGCLQLFGQIPEEHEYDFILINQRQISENGVCSRGYLKRGIKKLDKLLNRIDELVINQVYEPSPTPLCYWCDFPDRCHTPNADPIFAGMCEYFSLWKPDNKSFAVNKTFNKDPDAVRENTPKKRKLIF